LHFVSPTAQAGVLQVPVLVLQSPTVAHALPVLTNAVRSVLQTCG
jgi:hypothetical protein